MPASQVSEFGRGSAKEKMSTPVLVQFSHPGGWVQQKTTVNKNGEAGSVQVANKSSGVHICKSIVNYLRHGNYICNSGGRLLQGNDNELTNENLSTELMRMRLFRRGTAPSSSSLPPPGGCKSNKTKKKILLQVVTVLVNFNSAFSRCYNEFNTGYVVTPTG